MEEKKDRTKRGLQVLEELENLALDFDITIKAQDIDIGRVARLAGEYFYEFWVFQTEEGTKIIRIRD